MAFQHEMDMMHVDAPSKMTVRWIVLPITTTLSGARTSYETSLSAAGETNTATTVCSAKDFWIAWL